MALGKNKNVINKCILFVGALTLLQVVSRKQLIKHDAGEVREPSIKMRQTMLQTAPGIIEIRPLCGHFTETIWGPRDENNYVTKVERTFSETCFFQGLCPGDVSMM